MAKIRCLICLDKNDPDKEYLSKPPHYRVKISVDKSTLIMVNGRTLMREEVSINYCPNCGRNLNKVRKTNLARWEEDRVLYVTKPKEKK